MNRRGTLWGVSLLSVMFLLALVDSISAQATTTTTSSTTPINTVVGTPCAPESISITGQHHLVMHTTQTNNGTVRVFHFNTHGEGIGQTTGLKYEFTEPQTMVFNTHDSGAVEFTFVDSVHVISQGDQNDFRLRNQIHATINAQGRGTMAARAQVPGFVRRARSSVG